MKTKQIMLLLMSVLLLLTIVMGSIVLDRVSGLFQLMNTPNIPEGTSEAPTQSEATTQTGASVATTPPTQATQPPATQVPHTHNFKKSQVVSSTCTDWGYTLWSCSCGKTDTRDFVDPKGHNYETVKVVPLTCDQDGYTERVCSRCKDVDKQDLQTAPGHDYKFVKTHTGSCVDDAYDEHICSRCDDVRKDNLKAAPGHDFDDWAVTVPAGNDTPGKEQRTCGTCQKVETRVILPLNQGEIVQFVHEDAEWTSYVIRITWNGSQEEDTYNIYIGLNDRSIGYDYDDEGLTITYTVKGVDKHYTFPLDKENPVLTVSKDGKVSVYAPGTEPDEPDEPDVPDTSEPSTSEPGTSEPGTSEPGTSEPGTSEPGTSAPSTSEPSTSEPSNSEPGTSASE